MKSEKDLEFMLGLSGFFVLFFLLINMKTMLAIPVLLVLVSLLWPAAGRKIATATRRILVLLREVVLRFVLSVFFLFVLLPIAVGQRLIGRDS